MSSRSVKRRPAVKKSRRLGGGLSILAVVLVFVGALGFGTVSVLNSWFTDLPDYKSADAFSMALPSYIYASDGETVLARLQVEYREPVEMNQINPLLVEAVVATEDARYYEHSGVDYYGVMRALVRNLTGGSLEGGSTITQQLVRNTVLAGEMGDISIKRKLREAYIALELDKMYSKDEILLMYLNTVNFGAGAYGVEAASQRYFSKHASELTLNEAALLAGIPQSPTYNDPLQYPERALARRNIVLYRMLSEHVITQEQYDATTIEPLTLNPSEQSDDYTMLYPYFTSYVRYLLYNNYDLTESDILRGGLSIYTTLDVGRQEAAEEAAAAKRSYLPEGMEVAIAVVDPKTGNVQAVVGGSDFSESQVNLATGQGGGGRPCGSVFKVFTLAEAVSQGIDPDNTYVDCTSPATVDGYTLSNIDNINYGTRSLTGALAVSSNTGFVRLATSLGIRNVAQMAHDMGVTADLHEETAGGSLTLGVENVTPLELANAFGTIANGGVRHDLCAISRIEDRNGNVIVDDSNPEARATRVLTPQMCYALQKSMKTVVQSGTGTAAALYNGQPVAGKTGTSENYKDITFAGITPFLSAAIWVGDPSNQSSVPTGSCADVFRMVTSTVMQNERIQVEDFPTESLPEYVTYNDQDHQIYSYYNGYYNYGYNYYNYGNTNSTGTNNANNYSGTQQSPTTTQNGQTGQGGQYYDQNTQYGQNTTDYGQGTQYGQNATGYDQNAQYGQTTQYGQNTQYYDQGNQYGYTQYGTQDATYGQSQGG